MFIDKTRKVKLVGLATEPIFISHDVLMLIVVSLSWYLLGLPRYFLTIVEELRQQRSGLPK
jgi:hypothetical protein